MQQRRGGAAARRGSLRRQEHYEPAKRRCISRCRSMRGHSQRGHGWSPTPVPEVDGLVGEQAVCVGGVQQRQRQRRRVGRVLAEGVVRDARAHCRLAVGPAQPHPLQPQCRHGLALQDQLRDHRGQNAHRFVAVHCEHPPATPRPHLIRDFPLRTLRGIPLILVDERFHHPLLTEGGEARGLVVQLVHKFLRPVGLELQVCNERNACTRPCGSHLVRRAGRLPLMVIFS